MTEPNGWENPAESDFFTIKDHVGSLCLLAVNGFTEQMPTVNGFRDTVHAEIAVIDGPNAGKRYAEGLIFGAKLVPQVKSKIGKVVLGRITLGAAQPGKNAPYILTDPTPEDAALATAWVQANGSLAPRPIAKQNTPPPPPPNQGRENWQVAGAQAQGQGASYPTQQLSHQPSVQNQQQHTTGQTYTQVGVGSSNDGEPPF